MSVLAVSFLISNFWSACEFVEAVLCVSFVTTICHSKLRMQYVKLDTKISNKQQPSYTTKLLIAKTDQNPGAMHSVPCMPRAVFLMVCIFVIFSSFHLISLVFFYFLSCSSFFRMLPNNGRKKPCSPLDGGNPADYRLKNSYRVVQDFFCPLQST